MNKAVIFNIMRCSIHDGPGIRTTVFFKGCPLSCKWCHNPESFEPQPEKTSGETVGYEITITDLMKEINKDALFFEQSCGEPSPFGPGGGSGGGVTFSGGEPFFQTDFLLEILTECKKDYIRAAIDTCGYCDTEILLKAAQIADCFLYDIKFMDCGLHQKYCGVPNDLILKNLKSLSETKTKLLIRIPVIPGINDNLPEMASIFDFIKDFPNIETVHLLPYHNIHSEKYKRLGKQYELPGLSSEKSPNMNAIEQIFSGRFRTKIGG